ncbi:MAG: hypothetical protein OEY96_03810 [Gammaproteobacteria bacterium]|nr:hypothetical protein [Gammaproteobacteria bacterium]
MDSELISWILVAEITLPFFLLSVITLVLLAKKRKFNQKIARDLIQSIKNNETEHKSELLSFLKEKLSQDEESASNICSSILNERKFLFRNLISGLLDSNAELLISLDKDMSRIVQKYHDLEVVSAKKTKTPDGVSDESEEDLPEIVERLKGENKSLKQEVHVTLTTLNNIFGEFSSMFGEEVPKNKMSVDQIINAMETFSSQNSGSGIDDEDDIEVVSEKEEVQENTTDSEILPEKDAVETSEQDTSAESSDLDGTINAVVEPEIDDELDELDSMLDALESGEDKSGSNDDEPSWDDAFEESGDKM